MFTIEEIKEAHAVVKSGVDFPLYVQKLIELGVESYTSFVVDGHTEYFGTDGYAIQSNANYEPLTVAASSDQKKFMERLATHQTGGSDYVTFCQDTASAGIEKWVVDMKVMTCTYYDRAGAVMLAEVIPLP